MGGVEVAGSRRLIGNPVLTVFRRHGLAAAAVAVGTVLCGTFVLAQGVGDGFVAAVLAGARDCVRRAPLYDPAYVPLAYPGGDPGWRRGVCTDVVIRSFRTAGVDLQVLVHEDVQSRPAAYRISRPDPSIDHRRVRNLVVFFSRYAETLPVDGRWQPGDIVVWDLKRRGISDHIGILSDRSAPLGRPLVFHHFPRRGPFTGHPSEDDCLHRWRILHHFRWRGGAAGT